MPSFKLPDSAAAEKWSSDYMKEYVRQSGFYAYMSSAANAIIKVDTTNLSGKDGEVVHYHYYKRLTGGGLTGAATSFGAEDSARAVTCSIKARYQRNVVNVPESETFRTPLDVADAVRGLLKDWSAEKLRDDLITAAQSLPVKAENDTTGVPGEDTYVTYAAASATTRNAFLANNSDRVLFGSLKSNNTGTMSTSLANVDGTADKMSVAMIRLAKSLAKKVTNYKINPYRTEATAGREWFILFVDSNGFRDVCADPVLIAADKDARARDVDTNPLFQSGDRIIEGVIVRELPEMPSIAGVGAGSINVGHAVLCGAGALGLTWAMKPTVRNEQRDLGLENRLGIVEIRGQSKLSYEGVQAGMVSIFHASVDDA